MGKKDDRGGKVVLFGLSDVNMEDVVRRISRLEAEERRSVARIVWWDVAGRHDTKGLLEMADISRQEKHPLSPKRIEELLHMVGYTPISAHRRVALLRRFERQDGIYDTNEWKKKQILERDQKKDLANSEFGDQSEGE